MKRLSSSKRQKLVGALHACVLCQFSVSPRIYAPILPHKLQKDYKMFSMWLQNKNKLKYRAHYAIFQNRHIYADRPAIWLGSLCGLWILPYINGLRFALVRVDHQAVYAFLACIGVECVRAWVCLTVFCICKCRCKIYYTL